MVDHTEIDMGVSYLHGCHVSKREYLLIGMSKNCKLDSKRKISMSNNMNQQEQQK